jgi:hypothetical protein
MENLNDLRKSYCYVYLKELNSIQNIIEKNENLKEIVEQLGNYLDQFSCIKNSKIIIHDQVNIREKTIFKINFYINEKIGLIKLIL